ncbi:phosphatidylinositol 3,4,5-trisphosphate 3-phosphatase and dual-specificity protein phosphatase PTEN isoform X3 [Ctenocephalides felis]|uniref:phosphatidylinositol 3,4,5-trisphosphate 3-phosphatase and dual-specificity protein phosphatase PTEN isoform X3 n=1 Tax=Ctenocephalides felis TaxID=7515 RepID=UPI000E6E1376|nr:phosphatidylinositol 3,4,5-trisphosphate 3-phosphatase and dual-specificity protein phosphatase PTEN isoform X3 [Ctenocephalides felis]
MGLCFSCRREATVLTYSTKQEHLCSEIKRPLCIYVDDACSPSNAKRVSVLSDDQHVSKDSGLGASVVAFRDSSNNSDKSHSFNVEHNGQVAVKLHINSVEYCCNKADTTCRMANTISNMKMTNPIKGLISKRRRRYTKDGFNLDLTYIEHNLIAMGFPAEKLEGVYRNHIEDVVKFFELKHRDHYKIYNLCSERSYDCNKFQQRVSTYAFDDHNPPDIELIEPFCADVHMWLSKDCRNVAAVHCKAGKGRTGTMVCCYMIHSGKFTASADALAHYGQMRTHDRKGVTIPSQRRYVDYYAQLVRDSLKYEPVTVHIVDIVLLPAPVLSNAQGNLHFSISQSNKKMYNSLLNDPKKPVVISEGSDGAIRIKLDNLRIPLTGDIKLEFFTKTIMGRREKLFHFWFNPFFVRTYDTDMEDYNTLGENTNLSQDDYYPNLLHTGNGSTNSNANYEIIQPTGGLFKLTLNKSELDDAHKDKQHKLYSADFQVTVRMQRVCRTSGSWNVGRDMNNLLSASSQDVLSESSEASSSEESNDEDRWDSDESTYL